VFKWGLAENDVVDYFDNPNEGYRGVLVINDNLRIEQGFLFSFKNETDNYALDYTTMNIPITVDQAVLITKPVLRFADSIINGRFTRVEEEVRKNNFRAFEQLTGRAYHALTITGPRALNVLSYCEKDIRWGKVGIFVG
jgi:hypothetical protein